MWGKILLGASAVAVAGAAYNAYKDFVVNEVIISLFEYVPLGSSDTQSFTDLSSTVEGEIRVESYTTSLCTLLLKTNGKLVQCLSPSQPRQQGTRDKFTATDGGTGFGFVPLDGVEVNDMVDGTVLAQRHHVQFTPACTSHQTLLRYRTRLHEQFAVPVSVRDSVVTSEGPGVSRLSFDLLVHAAVFDLEVSIGLPKRVKVISVDHHCIGSWRPSHEASNEVCWVIGASGTGTTERHETASLATVQTTVQQQQQRLFGKKSSAVATGSGTSRNDPSRAEAIRDETVLIPNYETYPKAELGDYMERIPFSMTYVVAQNSASRDDSFVPALPAVSLSYAIAATASGLTVSRLQVLSDKENWTPPQTAVWRVLRAAVPSMFGARLVKKVRYTTRFSQLAEVTDERSGA